MAAIFSEAVALGVDENVLNQYSALMENITEFAVDSAGSDTYQ
jgi:hypothetical protein